MIASPQASNNNGVMFGRYSDRARQVIAVSIWAARKRGGTSIQLEDLLQALIMEDQNQLSAALAEIFPGIPPKGEEAGARQSFFSKEASERLQQALAGPPGKTAVAAYGDLPLTEPVKQVLAAAKQVADSQHHKIIEPLHLLAAIIEDCESRLAGLLKENGLTRQDGWAHFNDPKILFRTSGILSGDSCDSRGPAE